MLLASFASLHCHYCFSRPSFRAIVSALWWFLVHFHSCFFRPVYFTSFYCLNEINKLKLKRFVALCKFRQQFAGRFKLPYRKISRGFTDPCVYRCSGSVRTWFMNIICHVTGARRRGRYRQRVWDVRCWRAHHPASGVRRQHTAVTAVLYRAGQKSR